MAFQGQWNTTKRQNRTTTTVKNPNWLEANQLAIYKCGWEVEPGTTRIKFNEWLERVLNQGSSDLKASALTTGPHCLRQISDFGQISDIRIRFVEEVRLIFLKPKTLRHSAHTEKKSSSPAQTAEAESTHRPDPKTDFARTASPPCCSSNCGMSSLRGFPRGWAAPLRLVLALDSY